MRTMLTGVALAILCASTLSAQKVKSKKEAEAIMAVQNAADNKARLEAIDNVLTKFADTEYKAILLGMAAETYRQVGEIENMMVYAERAIEADPNNYGAMLMLGNAYVSRTKEFDLDKEEKLGKAEGYANKAIELLKTAAKPNPQLPDDQWNEAKKQMTAQGYEVLGTAAMVRKKYDVAATQYKLAIDQGSPDPATLVRLASAYTQSGNPDAALPLLEKVMATPDAHPQVKSVAQAERVRATQAKNAKAAPPKPAAPPSAPQPEPVK